LRDKYATIIIQFRAFIFTPLSNYSQLPFRWQLKIHYKCIHERAFTQLRNKILKKNAHVFTRCVPLHIIYRYYAISITVLFFAATWYRKFFVEIVKCLFSCIVRAIWKISFVPTWIQILGHSFTFLVAAYRSVRYNTLTDIPIHTRNIYDRHASCRISAILKINYHLSQIIFRIRAQCWIFSREIQIRYKNSGYDFPDKIIIMSLLLSVIQSVKDWKICIPKMKFSFVIFLFEEE